LKRRQPAGHPRTILALEQWWRWIRYRLIIPVFRSPHSPEHTARGVANGVFWGLTPIIGLQTGAIVATWFVSRKLLGRDSSLLQAFVWVWVNNPLTLLPMYYTFYVTGLWMMGEPGAVTGYETFGAFFESRDGSWLARVWTVAETIGLALLLGCLPYAAVGSALSYRWAMAVVRRRRHRLGQKRIGYETFRTSDPSG
jgi:uncharacterized protein